MDIGEQMLICGAEVYRVEDSVKRMCTALGAKRVDVFFITTNMTVTIYDEEDTPYTQTRRVSALGTDIHGADVGAVQRYVKARKTLGEELFEDIMKKSERLAGIYEKVD